MHMSKQSNDNPKVGSGFYIMIGIIIIFAILSVSYISTEYNEAMMSGETTGNRTIEQAGILGTKGDYYGGLLNPIFGFLSLMALLYTIVLQSRELSLSRQELEETKTEVRRSADAQEKSEKALNGQLALQAKQSFETTFFNLISLHNSILNSLTVDLNSIGPTLSKDYGEPGNYEPLGHQGRQVWVGDKTEFSGRELYQKLLNLIVNFSNNVPSNVQKLYAEINSQHNEVLGHYFRNFYQTLKFIEEGPITDIEKQRYASILRAQLSSFELALLFLNCIDDTVDNGAFRKLLCNYKILEHLPIRRSEMDANDDGISALYTFADSDMVIADKAMIEQYLEPQNLNSNNQVEFGAFGTNRVVTEVYSKTPLGHPE